MQSPTYGSVANSSPFTATQWQELEHQALIFKYMVSGVPVPPELLYPVKRSLESSLSSRLYPQQPIGWGLQVDFGRKADPEPGRCRRTDGKKWRCSKEAYHDSKYCEKHMHRGRNRSRKLMELTSTAAAPTTRTHSQLINRNVTAVATSPSSSSCFSQLSSSVEPEVHAHQSSSKCNIFTPSVHPHSSSPRTYGFSSQSSAPHNLFMESGSSSLGKDYSYILGAGEAVDESAVFSEVSGGERSSQHAPYQLPMSCHEKGDSGSQFQRFPDNLKQQRRPPPERHHCFVLGTDINSSVSNPVKWDNAAVTDKPLHQFFGDWPPKQADTSLDFTSSSKMQSGGI